MIVILIQDIEKRFQQEEKDFFDKEEEAARNATERVLPVPVATTDRKINSLFSPYYYPYNNNNCGGNGDKCCCHPPARILQCMACAAGDVSKTYNTCSSSIHLVSTGT